MTQNSLDLKDKTFYRSLKDLPTKTTKPNKSWKKMNFKNELDFQN